MTMMRNTLTSTVALLSLAIATPLPAQAAQSACLDEVAALRAQLESGKLTTLDLDADAENRSSMVDGSAPGAAPDMAKRTATGTASTEITAGIKSDQQAATDGTNAKAESQAEGDVVVETKTGDVEVPVSDGEPRENWFGRPPADKTAEDYLEGAETAARDGDEAACLEQLNDARAALTIKTE